MKTEIESKEKKNRVGRREREREQIIKHLSKLLQYHLTFKMVLWQYCKKI